jgi:TonB-linked SusC/RagA family outer membrane protein
LSNSIGVLSNAYLEVDFLKNFLFKSSLSADLNNNERKTFYPSTTGTLLNPPPILATGSHETHNSKLWLFENTLNYDKTIAENHNIGLLVGYSAQDYQVEASAFSGNQFPDNVVPWLSAAANITGWSNTKSEWSLFSMYSRLNYNYKRKYLLTASIRRDGSSRFGSEKRWGNFPSVSAGWILSEENFAKNWSTVSFLKLRAEYGATGNFNIGDYSQFANISPSNYVFGNSLASGESSSSIGNRELTWETTNGMDLGLDVAFFNDRATFTFDYYKKSTEGLLYQTDIPGGTGFLNIQSNIGQFDFWGYEFALSTKNFVRKFKWNTDFNISLSRNKVIKLGTNNQPIGSTAAFNTSNSSRTAVGHPIGQIFGYVSDGVYMTQEEFDKQPKMINSKVGTARFKDISGPQGVPDGKIDAYDRTFIGNPTPKFIFGMTNTLSYKKFDLNIIATGAYKQDKILAIMGFSRSTSGNFNVEKILKDRWRSIENPGAGIIGRTLTGTSTAGLAQSNYVYDASYLTIKNITLGYALPMIKYIRSARIFASIQQAFVFTKYKGSNPETSVWGLNGLNEGLDGGMYPVPRTFALGVNFNF